MVDGLACCIKLSMHAIGKLGEHSRFCRILCVLPANHEPFLQYPGITSIIMIIT